LFKIASQAKTGLTWVVKVRNYFKLKISKIPAGYCKGFQKYFSNEKTKDFTVPG